MNVGLAFSGGGARAIAHLGIVSYLQEHDFRFHACSGTSAGAIVGAFLAADVKPKEVLEVIIKTKLYKYIRPAISWRGLLKLDVVSPILENYLPVKTFEDLSIPLHVAATHITEGKTVIFSKGDIVKPLLASSSVPVIFEPVMIKGEYYMDGGILNNLPVEPIRKEVDWVIGMNCNPVQKNFKVNNMKNLMERSLLMAINYNTYDRKKLCDLFLEPAAIHRFNIFDFKHAEQIFNIGYRYASKHKGLHNLLEKNIISQA